MLQNRHDQTSFATISKVIIHIADHLLVQSFSNRLEDRLEKRKNRFGLSVLQYVMSGYVLCSYSVGTTTTGVGHGMDYQDLPEELNFDLNGFESFNELMQNNYQQ